MAQIHLRRRGTLHIITNTRDEIPWCTRPGIPEILIDNLAMTRSVKGATLFAFCILPTHLHILLEPGPSGIGAFMQSFKQHAMRDIRQCFVGANHDSRLATIHESSLHHHNIKAIEWQKGYYDRIIRTARQRSAAFRYVRNNAHRHGLVSAPHDWPWSSILFPHIIDGMDWWPEEAKNGPFTLDRGISFWS